jgi:hypothetical protein
VTKVCCFDRVVSVLNICMNCGLFLSGNNNLIRKIMREFDLFNVGLNRALIQTDALDSVLFKTLLVLQAIV